MPALYTSLSVLTALREAHRVGNLQPTTLVAYEAEIERVFDARDESALEVQGMSAARLADAAWRDEARAAGKAATQSFARTLVAAGFHALLVRSFAPGAGPEDLNLVLWTWSGEAGARLRLIDDEGRLS